MKNTLIAAAIAAAGLVPAAAVAQEAAPAATVAPTVGAKVFDPEGGQVGTIEAIQGDVVTVSTGTARAGLPASAFVTRDAGLTIAMTKAELEAAVNGQKAETGAAKQQAMVVDAPVKSSDGKVLGTISKIEGDDVTVALADGEGATVAFKQNNIGLLADGSLAIGMTADAFAQAIGAAGSAQASTDAAASTGAEAAATTGN
ncbi:hypothetical protein I5E68_12400 [Novosphingobium sp. YJ-S2-02]|uniref:PRC-barrel domain-containing protein n=1 Tax=Novosphingobium aureum TaxID=2792964 RepID=A0A931HE32_9SPHN|nr:hypothetical protein [Novosphingobium aureum]MBH0113748.1 hypothetical protein [Novosphingobium aureum]